MEENITKRVISPALEEILYHEDKVLDHGFIRVIDYMGSDSSIVQAARVSYGKGTKQVSKDKGLINYLLKNKHTTPFEMCEIKLHVKLPIFVARQWIRHRTANVNEISARYSILDHEFYLPDVDNISIQSQTNKQGRENQSLSFEKTNKVLEILKSDAQNCYNNYLSLINEDTEGNIIDSNEVGIARELARINLPVSCYTQFYWKIDLHNFMHFVFLRMSDHAQYEIRVYAKKMLSILQKWVPYVYDAFVEHRVNSKTFSANQMQALKRLIKKENVSQENSGLSVREWIELSNAIELGKVEN
jgi:thymidylate synthase (FAD)